MISYNCKSASILALKTTDADININLAAVSEAIPILVTSTRLQVKRSVAKQTCLGRQNFEIVEVVSAGTRLQSFELTKIAVVQ